MSHEKISISITKDLYNKIKHNVQSSQGEFTTVEEYIEFVLQEVLKEEEPKQVYTPEEEKEIKKRLRSLGYL